MQSSLNTVTILTELPLEVIFQTVDVNHLSIWECVKAIYASKIKLCIVICIHYKVTFLLQMCGRCVSFQAQFYVIYTCITKQDSIYTCAGFGQLSVQNCSLLYTLSYTVSLLTALTFSALRRPEKQVSVKFQAIIMIMEKTQFTEMLMNIFRGNMIINWKTKTLVGE